MKPEIKAILEDLDTLHEIDSLPIAEVSRMLASLKTEEAKDYLSHIASRVKPETALSDDIFKRIIDQGGYLGMSTSPQVLSGRGWVDFLLNPGFGQPVAIELKPLHKLRTQNIVRNDLQREYEHLKNEYIKYNQKNQIQEYLDHHDYVILTNTQDAYYFNRKGQVDFQPFLIEKFSNLIEDLLVNPNIWDVVCRKEDRTPKHNLDRTFFSDLKQWYNEFKDVAFKPGVLKEEQVVLLLNKFIFLKTLEDHSLVPFNLIKKTYMQKKEAWSAKGQRKVFYEFFQDLNNWAYAYYNTELFKTNIFDSIVDDGDNYEELKRAVVNILGYENWNETHWLGLSFYNYRQINEDIFGKAYETFLAESRKQQGIFYTPTEITEYMSQTIIDRTFGPLKEKLFAALDNQDATAANEAALGIADVKIIDPACGSGSFLVKVLKHIWKVYQDIDQHTRWATQTSGKELFDEPQDLSDRREATKDIRSLLGIGRDAFNGISTAGAIILRHLYGIDLDEKAIDVAKVNIWKEAVKLSPVSFRAASMPKEIDHVLPDLGMNLITANTLVDLPFDESIGILLDRCKDDIVKLSQIRVAYLNNPLDPSVLSGLKNIKARLRKVLTRAFKKKNFYLDTPASFLPMEFFFCFFDRNGNQFDESSRGFTGVIGNPPYVRADSGDVHLALRKTLELSGIYKTLWEKWDLYVPFMERGYQLLKENGHEMMIVSDAYCHSKYAQKSQNWFLNNASIARIDYLSNLNLFEEAAVHNVICLFRKSDGRDNEPERRTHEATFGEFRLLPTARQSDLSYRVFFPEAVSDYRCEVPTVPLSDICYISKGMVVNADEKVAKGSFQMKDLVLNIKDDTHTKPFVEGKHLDRWLPATHKWLEWGTERAPSLFSRPTFPELYEVDEKILVQRSPGPDPKACYDDQHLHFTESSVGFILWQSLAGVRNKSLQRTARYTDEKPRLDLPRREDLEEKSRRFCVKYLLAVMNSNNARDFLRANRRSNIHVYPDDWKQLPIPEVTKEQQEEAVSLVNQILFLKLETADPGKIEKLEQELDVLIDRFYAGAILK